MTRKTTVYLPDELKRSVEVEARRSGRSEAEVIRQALADGLQRPGPRGALFEAEPIADRADELLAGFGER
jgi:predicted transcriptional regulator